MPWLANITVCTRMPGTRYWQVVVPVAGDRAAEHEVEQADEDDRLEGQVEQLLRASA